MDIEFGILKNQQNSAFVEIAEILNGIASPVRIKLVHFLSQGPLTVEVLASKIGQSVANTSMHLQKMLASQIVSVSAHAQKRIYSLHPSAFEFWEACQNFAQQVDPSLSIEPKVYGDVLWMEDMDKTLDKIKNKEVILLDVRPSDEVNESLVHLNILNIPASELTDKISKLPKRKPVLVFCRGRFCALSLRVVNELREKGINAYRLNQSWYALNKYSEERGPL